jgi:hypothetical protein
MDSKNVALIKELAERIPSIDDRLDRLLRDMKTLNLDDIRSQIKLLN